jgi:hypothetical protein
MSNYPPGVTGREYEIAGPSREYTDTRKCAAVEETPDGMGLGDECGWEGEVDIAGYGEENWWVCPKCGTEHTEWLEISDES